MVYNIVTTVFIKKKGIILYGLKNVKRNETRRSSGR